MLARAMFDLLAPSSNHALRALHILIPAPFFSVAHVFEGEQYAHQMVCEQLRACGMPSSRVSAFA